MIVARLNSITKSLLGSLLLSLEENPEELDRIDEQIISPTISLAGLSDPDEAALTRIRTSKRGRVRSVKQIVVVRSPINFRPILPVKRTLDHPRFQVGTFNGVMT
jgi:hypothetical protein